MPGLLIAILLYIRFMFVIVDGWNVCSGTGVRIAVPGVCRSAIVC